MIVITPPLPWSTPLAFEAYHAPPLNLYSKEKQSSWTAGAGSARCSEDQIDIAPSSPSPALFRVTAITHLAESSINHEVVQEEEGPGR
jgi:hypothetical protein